MDNIIEPNSLFDFTKLSLAQPTGIQGGAYFTKILYNDKPLYVQAPKCSTKQGFVKNGKKLYCDLMFDNSNEQLINWFEKLESRCQELIYGKAEAWFQNQLEMTDIENAFASSLRVYKSGKYYLVRTNVKMNYATNTPNIRIYNESEIPMSVDEVVAADTKIISIIEIQGIKFTSRNFQIDIELKQAMILNTDILFDNCLIKTNHNKETFRINKEEAKTVELNNMIHEVVANNIIEADSIVVDTELDLPTDNSSISLEALSNNIVAEIQGSVEEPVTLEIKEMPNESNEMNEIYEFNESTNFNESNNFNELTEVALDISLDNDLETMTLKKPNQVYYEIYKQARQKAKEAKKTAIEAYLEAKNIKTTYMLDDMDESEEDEDENEEIMEELEE